MSNALIPIIQREGKPAVSARELYRFLELDPSNYSRWAKANITENGFAAQGEDWTRLVIQDETPNGGKIDREDFTVTLPFAKKLAMMSKSAKGEQVRDYFLLCEAAAVAAISRKPAKRLPHQTEAWLETRTETKGKRKTFAGVLAAHGCTGEAFSLITNAEYVALFGRTAAELRQRYGYKKSVSLRDRFNGTALLALGLTEAVAAEQLSERNVQGSFRCQETVATIAGNIARAIGGKLAPVALPAAV